MTTTKQAEAYLDSIIRYADAWSVAYCAYDDLTLADTLSNQFPDMPFSECRRVALLKFNAWHARRNAEVA